MLKSAHLQRRIPHALLVHQQFRLDQRQGVVMTSIRKSCLIVITRSFMSVLFAAFIIQGTIPVSAAFASTPLFHSVTFVENDSPSDLVYSSETANAPASLTSFANLSPAFVNSGFTFVDWNSSPDGTGTSFANASTFSFATAENLYAVWARDYHSVTFIENDNSSDAIYDVQTQNAPTALTMFASLSPVLSNPGFTFVDWNTESNGGGSSFGDGSNYSFTGPMVLFAIWSAIPTTIAIDVLTFDANGGTGSIASYSGKAGTSAILPTIDGMSMPGFAFSGWNTEADGSGTQYAEGTGLTLVNSQTLYAQWTAGPSDTVTFDANGGSGSIDPINGTPGSTITLPDQTGLIHVGFELTRWNTSATGSGTSYRVGQGFKLSGSIILYAQWSGHRFAALFGAIGTFKSGSSSLSASLKRQINRIANTIKSRKYLKVDLFGYTAATGLRSLNVSLSRARARNVAIYLRNRLHVLRVHGVTILSTGEGAIAGQSSNSYSRVEVFGV